MDWNHRINRAVCWRPVGSGHTPTGIPKAKEREPDPSALEELIINSRHVLGYVSGTKVEQQRKRNGEQPRLARVTPSDPDIAYELPNHGLQNPPSPTIFFNNDVLTTIFMHLADAPLESPPIFRTGANAALGSFLTISRVGCSHPPSQAGSQQLAGETQGTLRACSLVSKAWYHAAVKLLWYTAVLKLEDLDEELGKWGSGLYGAVDDAEPDYKKPGDDVVLGGYTRNIVSGYAPQRRWARRLVLIGGGTKSATSLSSRIPLQNLWDIFPCVQSVEIFGYGWGTDGLLHLGVDPPLHPGVTASQRRPSSFHHIRNLDIAATSEYILHDKVPGQNFLEVARFLLHLRALRSLILRGFIYRVSNDPATRHISNTASQSPSALQSPNDPPTSIRDDGKFNDMPRSPEYALEQLVLNKCSISLAALRWVVGYETYATLGLMEVDGCSFWDEEDVNGIWNMSEEVARVPETAFEAMAQRLSVDLPVFSMSMN